MKKLLFICMALCIVFMGCEKEGVYNPGKKIRRISEQPQGEAKQISQEWSWNKNLLQKVDYFSKNQLYYTENYKYDDKNRVIKVDDYENGDYYDISYNDNGYNKIDYYWNNKLVESYSFQYTDKKVSKISCTWFDNSKSQVKGNGSFIDFLFPVDMKLLEMGNSKSKGDDASTATVSIKYNANNLSEVEVLYDNGNIYRYSYEDFDKYLNPFYSSFSHGTGLTSYSQNNHAKAIVRTTINDNTVNFTTDREFTYDGKYPLEIVSKTSYSDYTYRTTTSYEYLK